MDKFKEELEILINKYSIDNDCSTPDFVLANYLVGCLTSYRIAKETLDNYNKIHKSEEEGF